MDTKELMARIASLVCALSETSGGWAPASTLYMAVGMDIHAYETIASVAAQAGLVEKTSQTLTITSKGRDMAAKLLKVLG